MPKFKVINPDTPEEIDLVQDIPLVDEETGSDQIDSEGNILVKRYVTRTVNLNGINAVKNSLPQIKENAKNLKDLYDYSHSVNTDQQNQILENSSKITELLTDTTALEVTVTELENKIKGIQGIDIDEVKADLDALKQSAYLITGGILRGDISVQTPNTATITLTPSGSSSFASFSCNNDVLDCTTTWGKLFKQSEEGGFFYGLSSTALADKNGKELTNYISDIMGSNAQLTFIKGDGTSQVISINNVISATKATNADNATNLGGYPATDYIRSVNGINADENGNIQLGSIVKSVNSITPNEQGNVQLDGLVKSVNGVNADTQGNVTITVDYTVRLVSTRKSTGDWTITGLTPYKPLIISYVEPNASLASLAPKSGTTLDGNTAIIFGQHSDVDTTTEIFIPTNSTVVFTLDFNVLEQYYFKAYQ